MSSERRPKTCDLHWEEPDPSNEQDSGGLGFQDVQAGSRSPWSCEPPGAAVELAVDLPGVMTRQGKEWLRDLDCFFNKQLRRNTAEVSEKHLNEAQLRLQQAKQKEVKKFIVAQAFQRLPEHLKPFNSQILKMRWILTSKLDDAMTPKMESP